MFCCIFCVAVVFKFYFSMKHVIDTTYTYLHVFNIFINIIALCELVMAFLRRVSYSDGL